MRYISIYFHFVGILLTHQLHLASSVYYKEAFTRYPATDAVELSEIESVPPPICALHCLSGSSRCEGFMMSDKSGSCILYNKICFLEGGPETYFGLQQSVFNTSINKYLAQGM